MSNKRYINQLQFNPSNSNNVINSIYNYLHQKNFKQINVSDETFFANKINNPFLLGCWVQCLKISFNGNVAFIEAWLVGTNMLGETKFDEEYGLDSMYGYLWKPISILKSVIRDVENIIL